MSNNESPLEHGSNPCRTASSKENCFFNSKTGLPVQQFTLPESTPQGATQAVQGLKSFRGNEICSGRGGGVDCQSRAQSTIWRIRRNHH